MTKDNKPTIIDRMNYTEGVETSDLMTEQERSEFQKMTAKEQNDFIQKVIIPRAVDIQ